MNIANAIILEKTVVAGGSATKGFACKITAGDTIDDCGAGEAGIGIFLNTAAAGEKARFALLAGAVRLTAKVGTGDATAGAYLVMAADGFTDAATLGGGTTAVEVLAMALEAGVAGDEINVMPTPFTGVTS